jgi:phosphatidylethanolamine-binding protein (PEBP) family uncharacterized protein
LPHMPARDWRLHRVLDAMIHGPALHLKPGAARVQIERSIRGHVLAHAELMGQYRRTA